MSLPLSASEICSRVKGDWVNREFFIGASSPDQVMDEVLINEPVQLIGAKSNQIAFFFSKGLQSELLASSPGVLITGLPFVEPLKKSGLPLLKKTVIIATENPYWAMGVVTELFSKAESALTEKAKVYPGAHVDASAEIGAGSVIYPGCFIGAKVVIGKQCTIFPNVTIYEKCILGDRVRVHASSVIGADGFGYAPEFEDGKSSGKIIRHQKIYHFGRVVIGNDVEIGANSCVDRGTFGDTILENQVKIDNHVQVGHNVHLGEGTVLCGKSGMTGGATTGRFVYIGAMSGVANKVHVGDEAKVGAGTMVLKNVEPGQSVVGFPHRPQKEFFLMHGLLNRMIEDRKNLRGKNK